MPYHRPLSFWDKTKIALSVVFHKRTPFSAKALLGAGFLYGLMPIDLIPDFLPFLGATDDAAILVAAILFFLRVTKALRTEMERSGDIIDVKPL